jgi:hypothetical protein
MQWFPKIIVILVLTTVILFSCTKKECDGDIPTIQFLRFEQFEGDSAKMVIGFNDCNGDIGLGQGDSIEPYKYNLYMRYFEKQNGSWIELTPLIPYNYRIPVLYDGTEDAIEGDIEISMKSYYNPTSGFDTIKYQLYITDRMLNESNTVETTEILKPIN